MPKITEKYIQSHYEKLIGYGKDKLSADETLVKEILQEHLSYIPNGKLYKYRNCSENNFQLLEQQSIWMAKPDEFEDDFDYILNINFAQNATKIKNWLFNHIDEFIYYSVKNFFESKKLPFNVSLEEITAIRHNCYTKEGRLVKTRATSYLSQYGSIDEAYKFLKTYDKIDDWFVEKEDQVLEKAVVTLIESMVKANQDSRNKCLIYCMCESYKEDSMWKEYSKETDKKHTGYCIEYDFSKALDMPFNQYKNLLFLLPVIYKKQRPIFDIVPFLEGAMREQYFNDATYKFDKKFQASINTHLLIKKSCYVHEREWRMNIENICHNIQQFPFVSAIILGKDIFEDNEKKLTEIANKLSVPILKQQLNKYGTDFEYIETKPKSEVCYGK